MEKSLNSPPPLPVQPAVAAVQVMLSVAVVIFLADVVLGLGDGLLQLAWHAQWLTPLRGVVGVVAFFAGLVVYFLSGLTPLVPKRFFLPLTLLPLVLGLCQLPLFVLYPAKSQEMAVWLMLVQALVTSGLIYLLGCRTHWPLVPLRVLGKRVFSLWNVMAFVVLNGVALVPVVVGISVLSTTWIIAHLSQGFVTVRPTGVVMQARTYRRESDQATIRLIPMSHIAQSSFYAEVMTSIPEEGLILAEGVSDRNREFKSKISYGKTAAQLGLAEQQVQFKPTAKSMPADVDLADLNPLTLAYLREVMQLHSQGITAENLPQLLQSTPPDLVEVLIEDILYRRNRHLLAVLETQLTTSKNLIIPWGAAHMPGISEGIRKSGFVQVDSADHLAIPFFR